MELGLIEQHVITRSTSGYVRYSMTLLSITSNMRQQPFSTDLTFSMTAPLTPSTKGAVLILGVIQMFEYSKQHKNSPALEHTNYFPVSDDIALGMCEAHTGLNESKSIILCELVARWHSQIHIPQGNKQMLA